MDALCECCNHPVAFEPHAICTNCWWEEDTIDPDKWSYVNHSTLRQARANYWKYGAYSEHGYWLNTGKEITFS